MKESCREDHPSLRAMSQLNKKQDKTKQKERCRAEQCKEGNKIGTDSSQYAANSNRVPDLKLDFDGRQTSDATSKDWVV
jgi:hypothetical protein